MRTVFQYKRLYLGAFFLVIMVLLLFATKIPAFAVEETISLQAEMNGTTVCYQIDAPNLDDLILLVGCYDASGKMVDAKVIPSPVQSGSFAICVSDYCRLFVVRAGSFRPVCRGVIMTDDLEILYQPVLEQYRQYINEKIYTDYNDGYPFSRAGKYINKQPLYIYGTPEHPPKVCYAFYDLDGNGMEELIMGILDDYYPNGAFVLDVFTSDGSEIVNVFNGEPTSFGFFERNTLTINSNGILRNWGNGGAGIDVDKIYRFQAAGYLTHCVETVACDWTNPPGHEIAFLYTRTDENGVEYSITKAEYDSMIEQYNAMPVLDLDWIDLF